MTTEKQTPAELAEDIKDAIAELTEDRWPDLLAAIDRLAALATAQQAERVPLTDTEIDIECRRTEMPRGSLAHIGDAQWLAMFRAIARAIERTHEITPADAKEGE